ncbi:MAG: hypothetical protein PHO14_00275 [Kiritimatiellae bacterium]|nr:hypothetical protein [Kiritimatiellia bacterium]MDD4340649.1 hypothetical protein [Kiritimatiellia bacterium]
MDTPHPSSSSFPKKCLAWLPIALLAVWFGGMTWGIDTALRKFESHTSATPPHIDASESWRQARLFIDPDAYCWLSYTRDLRQSGQWRLRHTVADNAPYGREMHWSHLPIWSLMAISTTLEKVGVTPPVALELAGRLLMPLTGFLAFSALFFWLYRRIGFGEAALCALAPATLLFWDFHPLRPDHHAVQIMSAFFCWLALLFSGFGWTSSTRTDHAAKRYFILSGILGGFGLWSGATAFYFSLAAIALAATVLLFFSPTASDTSALRMRPEYWRIWSWAGAGTSLLMYALEYAPGPFPLRLEVNHPLYALSWLGIGEGLYLWARWQHADRHLSALRLVHAALALTAAATLPALVLFGPESAYLPRTLLMWRLHARHINEFVTMFVWASQNNQNSWLLLLRFIGPGLACIGGWLWLRTKLRLPFTVQLRVRFAIPLFVVFSTLLLWQIRWRPFAAMASLLVAIAFLSTKRPFTDKLIQRATLLLAILVGLQWLLGLWIGLAPLADMWKVKTIDPLYLKALQMRNLMTNLKAAEPTTPLRVLAPAEMTPLVYYFGVGDGIGSLYWENVAGLEAAVDFYADPLPGKRARDIVANRHITHVIMNEGAQDALMFYDLHTGSTNQLRAAQTVGGALTGIGTEIPPWLRYDEKLNAAVNPVLYTLVPAISQWAPSHLDTRIYTVATPPVKMLP